ncbi:MAG TPA: DUF4129 domain-containing protein [Microbacterium sp.]|uniref:DUF4129 domain-containing protein n=1 Tax=Microbacterium sp. TaxID=51671 RepID=UPI002BF2AB32|nr:DUF4129 domain-containing protein [Microbacterium sp.]HWI30461.1 DUF4129 domain-containing protein [Microbacterium sp.]
MIAGAGPLIPDGDEAREWAERELSRPVYAEAEPTPLDRIARAVAEFFGNLFTGEVPGGWGGPLVIVIAVVVTGLIVAAFLIWGRPRLSPRSSRSPLELFGAEEARSASELRRDAAAAAARGIWDDAIILRLRALARGLAERGIVEPAPGATVHAFARDAARAFPAEKSRLDAAASAFDDVRYLRRPGSGELYALVAAADDALVAARPALQETSV